MARLGKRSAGLVAALALWGLALQACGQGAPAATIPTAAVTAVPQVVAATSVPSPTARPVASPTATPTPGPTPCQHALLPELAEYWSAGLLGCPITPGTAPINTAYAPFEGGQMLWRGDTDTIYVLTHDGRWHGFPNEWRDGDPTFSCGEENPLVTPIRGFGRVWCDHPEVRVALGNATAEEIGDDASAVQDFGNGVILTAPFGGIFIFVDEDSSWRRADD